MFNQRTRRTGSSVGKSMLMRSAAIIGAVGIVGALTVAAPVTASATTITTATWAQGRFLSGSLAGLDLDTIVGLKSATARNNGAQDTQEVVDPLAVSLLGTTPLNIGAVRVSPDAVLSTKTSGGVLSQYAKAEKTGTALGASGKVSVDLNKLIGGNLNNRPVNSEILTGATVNKIVSTIAHNVTTLTDQVMARLDAALGNLKLDVDVDLNLLTNQAPIIGESCQYEDGSGNILGEVLGKLLGTLVCTPTTTLLPKLKTSVAVDVHGTVAQVLNGKAPATVTAQVLGIPSTISTGRVLTALSHVLGNRIYEAGGILRTVRGLLDRPLLSQANAGLLGSTSIQGVLSNILSIKVNLQNTTLNGGGMAVATNTVFTQTAMRVSVARAVGSSGLTTLNLAAASVAPVVNAGDPGGPGTDNPGDPGGLGGPGTDKTLGTLGGPAADGPRSLAYTGVALGSAIAALIGLLIAGAWLTRKGYLRNHPTLEP